MKCHTKIYYLLVAVVFYTAVTLVQQHFNSRIDHDWNIHAQKGKFDNKKNQIDTIFNKPRYEMRQDKFLMPILTYGPNNQMMGFREAVFVAIKLNRTVVIPTFEKHDSDRQRFTSSIIDPRHRLSITKMCSLVSCITIDQFREACENKIDAIMHLRKYTYGQLRDIENKLGMKIAGGSGNPTYLPAKYYERGTNILDLRFVFHPEEVHVLFKSSAKCAVFHLPFLNLASCDHTGLCKSFYRKLTDAMKPGVSLSPDEDLLLSIVEYSPRPRYVNMMANEFISKSMQNMPFLAVHWRYDRKDFMSKARCALKKMEFCKEALGYTPQNLAKRIEEKVRALHTVTGVQIRYFYIASPISEIKFVEDTAKILFKQHNWETFHTHELEQFVKKQHGNYFLSRIFDDILSTTDMEICSLGFAFLRSIRSTWSDNVKISRIHVVEEKVYPQYDEYIFDIS